MKIRLLILLFSSIFLCSACFDQVGDGLTVAAPTLLVYMGGDNNLKGEVQEKIDALTAAWTLPVGHLLVYRDAGGASNPCLLEIVRTVEGTNSRTNSGTNRIDTLKKYTELNSASAFAMRQAVCDAYERYPTTQFGLLVFSHGSGWLPEGALGEDTRTVVKDGTDELPLRDFAEALPNGLCRYIVFESCLMAGLEVAYELREKTDYIVASSAEIVSPGFTPLYGTLLPLLFKPEPELTTVAATYYTHCDDRIGDNRSATVSVIRTAELPLLKNMVHAAEGRVTNWTTGVQRNQVQHFDRRSNSHLFYDLRSYLKQIATPAELASFDQVMSRVVTYKASTNQFMPGSANGFDIKQHSGLTLYIPDPLYPELNEERLKLKLFQ